MPAFDTPTLVRNVTLPFPPPGPLSGSREDCTRPGVREGHSVTFLVVGPPIGSSYSSRFSLRQVFKWLLETLGERECLRNAGRREPSELGWQLGS